MPRPLPLCEPVSLAVKAREEGVRGGSPTPLLQAGHDDGRRELEVAQQVVFSSMSTTTVASEMPSRNIPSNSRGLLHPSSRARVQISPSVAIDGLAAY